MMPKVETFENNIAQEIKRKEASLTEISAASNNVGNDPVELPKKPPVFFIALVTFFILCLFGFGLLGYFYMAGQTDPSAPTETTSTPKIQQVSSNLATISPTLSNQIGRFITHVDKKEQGYILTISDYSPVFAYMTRNESSYIEELASLFTNTTVSTSTILIATSTASTTAPLSIPVTSTTTLAATGTQKIATSTKTTKTASSTQGTTTVVTVPTPTPEVATPQTTSSFSDITIANQNMRVWTSGKTTVVYAFVGNTTVLIANSKEGILALKGAILK